MDLLLKGSNQLKEANSTMKLLEAQNIALEKRLARFQTGWRKASTNVTRLRRQLESSTRASKTRYEAALKAAWKFSLKTKGVFLNTIRELSHKLVSSGIPASKVADVHSACAQAFKVDIGKGPSRRTVSHAATEAGIAAEIQMAMELQNIDSKSKMPYS